MSSTDSIQFSPLDSSTCRILTVSSSLKRAVDLVDRIRNLGKPEQATPTPEASTSALASPELTPVPHPSGLGQYTRIPWTLSNKYYSADVHFSAHTITGLSPHVVQNVPAVIFVWSKGEAYKHHVERLAGDMSGYEPEVSLAVRVSPSASVKEEDSEEEEEQEEQAEIDEFLSSNGFEFIDAYSEETSSSPEAEEDSGPFSQGIPGLPRVLDALSTIMWPSMQAQVKLKSSGLPKLARPDFDWAQSSRDDLSPLGGLLQSGSKQHEALARWLEEDDGVSSRDDPWRSAADSAAVSTSPTGMDAPQSVSPDGGNEFGFDDDFTVFVSAPVTAEAEGPGDEDFGDDSFDSPRLGVPDASPLYLSLGSALDLREVDEEKAEPANEEDEDLPTDAEIEAMSSRIFGGPLRGKAMTESKSHAPMSDAVPLDAGGDEEYDMAPFDLSRVMSALEGMKAEIASMEDEGERRKAAAKVALGLVYGLEADAGIEE
ncbi:hypothetical protein C8R44DRAFT_771222 [Mycena epipterygia]|nr:hypothetical protein C8R44DRAFT_771222 [Mycena epipterygia]